MAVESASDLAAFFDTDDFGNAAIYTPSGGEAVTINGIFDNNHFEGLNEAGVPVSVTQPRFSCRVADALSPVNGSLVVDGTTYAIKDTQPDGTGMTRLILEDQS